MGSENIAEYINASEYELIIIGSHGSSGIKEKLIGSNAQKIIRNSLANSHNRRGTNRCFQSRRPDLLIIPPTRRAHWHGSPLPIHGRRVLRFSLFASLVVKNRGDKISFASST